MSDEKQAAPPVTPSPAPAPAPTRAPTKPKKQPPYRVVLLDDNDHSFQYVIRMMQSLFGLTSEKGFQIAETVDTQGRAIVLVTTREHAELKQQQIHGFGADPDIPRCKGAMTAMIEPVED